MKFSITNKSAVSVPVHAEGEPWAETISPNATVVLDKPGSVWIIGAFVSQRDLSAPAGMVIEVGMTNEGTAPVRMIPGEVEHEDQLEPNTGTTVTAIDYIELRELGGWEQGGT
jgi:hypothetical protein